MNFLDVKNFIDASDALRKLYTSEANPTPDKVFEACTKYDHARVKLLTALKMSVEN